MFGLVACLVKLMMDSAHERSFNHKTFLIVIIALIITLLIDTSVVKINDLINKFFIPVSSKLILFSINSSLCLLFQYYIIKSINSFKISQSNNKSKVKSIYFISLTSLGILIILIGILIFQQFYNQYYESFISILVIVISYGTASTFVIRSALLFLSWYKASHNQIIFLYFLSMIMIAFNLIMTAAFASIQVSQGPRQIGEFVGSAGTYYGGINPLLDNIYRSSSFVSFFGIWITTAIMMNYYREKLVSAITYWTLLALPLIYFIIAFFYQYTLGNILATYLENDPVTFSIIIGIFLSLSKPIGGLVFAVAFWKISRTVRYEINIRTYMIISGWGIFLIFTANQASTQTIQPYPPFGLVTLTVLNIAAFMILVGIYNSAKLVSSNDLLRKSIRKYTLESRLLSLIGDAEIENEIHRTVTKISTNKAVLEMSKKDIELDEKELRRYIDFVVKEVKKRGVDENPD